MPALLDERLWFPDPAVADDSRCPGLVAFGGDFSVERLLLAYRSGIFPWTDDPITWWSPDPRGIFELDQFHVSRSLRRVLKHCTVLSSTVPVDGSSSAGFEVTIDRAFRQVMEGCAFSRAKDNWITSGFIDAYTALHEAGHAHSVECWKNGELAGGIYGVAIGGLFAGESMFHRVSDASKVALYFLWRHLVERGFILFDIQMVTPITRQLGAVEIPRAEYLARVKSAVAGNGGRSFC